MHRLLYWFALLICAMAFLGHAISHVATGDEVRPGVFRTPEARFENLKDFPYEPHYRMLEGYRVHFVDEGPRDAEPVLLLHGEPSWCYLYRDMIRVLTRAGHRVIAPDLVGFGRSDKPAEREDHTYQMHVDVMNGLVKKLDLRNITMFCQDWGGLVGLRVAAEQPERFARIVAANTGLPAGNGEDDFLIGTQFTEIDPDVKLTDALEGGFLAWLRFSQVTPELFAGQVVQAGTVKQLSPEVVAAYDAPFPDKRYKAGPRVMPTLVLSQQATNRKAWEVFERWEKPFLTAFSDSDPVTSGGFRGLQDRIPGAKDQPHRTISDAAHFLQEDKGEELAALIIDFIVRTSTPGEGAETSDN